MHKATCYNQWKYNSSERWHRLSVVVSLVVCFFLFIVFGKIIMDMEESELNVKNALRDYCCDNENQCDWDAAVEQVAELFSASWEFGQEFLEMKKTEFKSHVKTNMMANYFSWWFRNTKYYGFWVYMITGFLTPCVFLVPGLSDETKEKLAEKLKNVNEASKTVVANSDTVLEALDQQAANSKAALENFWNQVPGWSAAETSRKPAETPKKPNTPLPAAENQALPAAEDPAAKTTCPHKMKKGDRKGQPCGAPAKEEYGWHCGRHNPKPETKADKRKAETPASSASLSKKGKGNPEDLHGDIPMDPP